MNIDLQSAIAVLSVVIPFVAFVWEFAVVRRKRLGYRVQMDTPAAGTTHAPSADVLAQMRDNGRELRDPSFVLIRVENAGWTEIVEDDYLTPANDPSGIRVTFGHRHVVGMALTERSQPELLDFFVTLSPDGGGTVTEAGGFGKGVEDADGIIRLPKVKLNPGAHYKVLAVLERTAGGDGESFPPPAFRADVKGRRNRWLGRLARIRLDRTESHTFASRPALVGIGLLAVAVLVQSGLTLFNPQDPPPLDCVGGTLHLHGSTAFELPVRKAAEKYVDLCGAKGARIPISDGTFEGSGEGLSSLEQAGRKAGGQDGAGPGDHVTFYDGEPAGDHPQLLARPVAYSLYALVVDKGAKVGSLSLRDIRDIYAGKIVNWSQVKGADLPIHLISRQSSSGTRKALVERVLNDPAAAPRLEVPRATTTDCADLPADRPGACEVDSTRTLLQTVATSPGALGMSEVSSAATAEGVVQLRIDQIPATLSGVEDGKYPYWQTEFAYTYGEPPADSIASAFLRYLTDQGGKDILREFGNRPCSETEYPLFCEPN